MTDVVQYRVRRSSLWTWVGGAILAVVAVFLAFAPYFLPPKFTSPLVMAFILILLASMWNLLAGFGGLVSIGQQAYIGVGAYTVVILARAGISPFLALPVAIIVAGIFAFPTSWFAFRLRGDYFAVGTWVIAEVYRLLIIKIPFIGGANSVSIDGGLVGMDPAFRGAVTYWLALAGAGLGLIVCVWLLRSRVGLSLTAIRDDETAARAGGINGVRVKRLTYLISAAGCGLAGAILAINAMNVVPSDLFGVKWSAYMILIVVIGGIGYIEGPILGAMVFFAMQQLLADWNSWYLILLGVLAIVSATVYPQGLWGLLVDKTGIKGFPIGYQLVIGEQKGLLASLFPGRSAQRK
jgi:branched-chain amino acid transport system permease protein